MHRPRHPDRHGMHGWMHTCRCASRRVWRRWPSDATPHPAPTPNPHPGAHVVERDGGGLLDCYRLRLCLHLPPAERRHAAQRLSPALLALIPYIVHTHAFTRMHSHTPALLIPCAPRQCITLTLALTLALTLGLTLAAHRSPLTSHRSPLTAHPNPTLTLTSSRSPKRSVAACIETYVRTHTRTHVDTQACIHTHRSPKSRCSAPLRTSTWRRLGGCSPSWCPPCPSLPSLNLSSRSKSTRRCAPAQRRAVEHAHLHAHMHAHITSSGGTARSDSPSRRLATSPGHIGRGRPSLNAIPSMPHWTRPFIHTS